jgi:hypothetical protein
MEELHMNRYLVAFFVLGIVVSGCQGDTKDADQSKDAGQAKGAAPASAEHAGAAVVAGSYEDWCGEHQVPESACTRCDPSLVAAFKATHDWCDEHGLPESQCLACNPDLKIVRPAKPEGN